MGSPHKIKRRGDFRLRGKGRRWSIKQRRADKPMVFRQMKAKPIGDISDPWSILKFVLMTEKAVRAVEAENMLVFIVQRKTNKQTVKAAFEKAFNTKVASVRTVIDQDSRKKALIKLSKPGEASEIAIKLGII